MARIIQEKCAGCGICASVCPGGIEMINRKADIRNKKADCPAPHSE